MQSLSMPSNITGIAKKPSKGAQSAGGSSNFSKLTKTTTSSSVNPESVEPTVLKLNAEQRAIIGDLLDENGANAKSNVILSMIPGAGKSLVTVFLICHLVLGEVPDELQKQQYKSKQNWMEKLQENGGQTKKIVIVMPQGVTSSLTLLLEGFTGFKMAFAQQVKVRKHEEEATWRRVLDENHILVFQDKKFYDVLKFGYLRMGDFDLAVFTHCHHAENNHVVNILTDFYQYGVEVLESRPNTRIIGLTEPEYSWSKSQVLATIFCACFYRVPKGLFDYISPGIQRKEYLRIDPEQFRAQLGVLFDILIEQTPNSTKYLEVELRKTIDTIVEGLQQGAKLTKRQFRIESLHQPEDKALKGLWEEVVVILFELGVRSAAEKVVAYHKEKKQQAELTKQLEQQFTDMQDRFGSLSEKVQILVDTLNQMVRVAPPTGPKIQVIVNDEMHSFMLYGLFRKKSKPSLLNMAKLVVHSSEVKKQITDTTTEESKSTADSEQLAKVNVYITVDKSVLAGFDQVIIFKDNWSLKEQHHIMKQAPNVVHVRDKNFTFDEPVEKVLDLAKNDSDQLRPGPRRFIDATNYIDEPGGARLHLRECKTFLKQFVDQVPARPREVKELDKSTNKPIPSKCLESEPVYIIKTTTGANNTKFFMGCLYLPLCLGPFLGYKELKVMPKYGFLKKKDAENHVAQNALKLLRDQKLVDKCFLPDMRKTTGFEGIAADNQSNQTDGKNDKHQISQGEKEEQMKKQKDHDQNMKISKSRVVEIVEDTYRMVIKQQLLFGKSSGFKLFVHCLKGVSCASKKNGYPFKNTADYIGVLYDKMLGHSNPAKFTLYHEQRLKDYNSQYMRKLLKRGVISEAAFEQSVQNLDTIEMELSQRNTIEVNFGSASTPQIVHHVQKLKFFHTFIFYYFYSGDWKFLQNFLKSRFTFANELFGESISKLYDIPATCKQLHSIFCPDKSVQSFTEKYVNSYQPLEDDQSDNLLHVYPYAVPLVQDSDGQLDINWALIDRIINFITIKLQTITRSILEQEEETDLTGLRVGSRSMTEKGRFEGIWDDRITGVRYTKMDQFPAHGKWEEPCLHIDRQVQQNLDETSQEYVNTATGEKLNMKRKVVYTLQQYNFDKHGVFLNPSRSHCMQKVRKEKFFQEMKLSSQIQTNKKAETQFYDTCDELIREQILTYPQFQVLQQTCTHMQLFNEYLQAVKFIEDKFGESKCLLEDRDKKGIEEGLEEQIKENQHSAKQPSIESRNIFWSPNEHNPKFEDAIENKDIELAPAKQQLLNNIDLVKEALTSPNANKFHNYERLEFYGDSVISFLVILELFLTKPYNYKENTLDFYRIKQVSNMTFYHLNKQQEFYKYMVSEPQSIFKDFEPGAFEGLKYSERLQHKFLNEQNNKVKELRKIHLFLEKLAADLEEGEKGGVSVSSLLKDMHLGFLTQLRVFMNENDENYPAKFYLQDQSQKSRKLAAGKTDLQLVKTYLAKVEECIEKTQKFKERDIKKIQKRKDPNQRNFTYKQLADVIESVTGATTVACGLNMAQTFLKGINVLNHSQADLRKYFEKLKTNKATNRTTHEFVYIKMNEDGGRMRQVEQKLGYTFKNKVWLVEALTHKGYIDQLLPDVDRREFLLQYHRFMVDPTLGFEESNQERPNDEDSHPYEDYERLEFLGDAIINFLIAEHFYQTTTADANKINPKELHMMKTSVINNTLLSLIVIENGIHEHILFNDKAIQFNDQFVKYVKVVQEMLAEQGGTSQATQALDIDKLSEYNLKIFGDVFESLIGAVFLDSGCIVTTWQVLKALMQPYIKLYSNLDSLQVHHRTLLLELWSQKKYMRDIRCLHLNEAISANKTVFRGMANDHCILEMKFGKEAKNKIRAFYKEYHELMAAFFDSFEAKHPDSQFSPDEIIKQIQKFSKDWQAAK